MFTRCPACEALYELTPGELAEAAGVVRCSNCGKTFNSLANLFDRQPEAEDEALRGQGMPPLLAHRILLQPNLPGLDQATSEPAATGAETGAADETTSRHADPSIEEALQQSPNRTGWPIAVALLVLLAVAQGLWLLDLPERWLDASPGTTTPIGPDGAVALVGRDMHVHPTQPDAVVINALLRNQSASTIDFPVIELRLFDRSGQIVGARRLPPDDYLPNPARAPSGLAPGTLLPLIVEVAVTGSEPAGFELRFF